MIAGLTQAIYPYLYSQLLGLDFTLLLVLSARNVLYVVLLVWAVVGRHRRRAIRTGAVPDDARPP